MEKFLYLTKEDWVTNWVDGGVIPIFPASTYLSQSRDGTSTPDENLIHSSPVDVTSLPGISGLFGPGINFKNLTYVGNVVDGVRAPDVVAADYYKEDGLVLSFCNEMSSEIAKRLKKRACVKILNIHELKTVIDEELGIEGQAGECRYTDDHNRDHFLKSTKDQWQNEYRIFWPITEIREVTLPSGLAEQIAL